MAGVGQVIYRLPGLEEHRYIAGAVTTTSIDAATRQTGFIVAPFTENQSSTTCLIAGDHQTINTPEDLQTTLQKFSDLPPSQSPKVHADYAAYEKQCTAIIHHIKAGAFEKAVLSRIHPHPFKTALLPQLYTALCENHKDAFVYLVNTPNTGCWIGATPERLLTADSTKAHTMSLAGTQPAVGTPENANWGNKEKHEQEVVTDFISKALEAHHINYQKKARRTLQAGKAFHLCTDFELKTLPASWPSLVKALHPTPAVCGLPRDIALQHILHIEPHDRTYYTGFLGPVSANQSLHLFVNLRCMQVEPKQCHLHLGGGITAGSEPIKEWKETELKAQTLLGVIEKIQTFVP